MTEQTVILFFLVAATASTLFLYLWKAKKEIEYKKDERWLLIQNRANHTANFTNYILIVLLAAGSTIPLFYDSQIMFTLQRVMIYGTLYIGTRNAIELFALKYFDKRL